MNSGSLPPPAILPPLRRSAWRSFLLGSDKSVPFLVKDCYIVCRFLEGGSSYRRPENNETNVLAKHQITNPSNKEALHVS